MGLNSGAVEVHAPLFQILDICTSLLVGRGSLLTIW